MQLSVMHLHNYINGKLVAPLSNAYLEGHNPSTGEILCMVPDSGEEDVEAAVNSASAAFKSWSCTSVEHRAKLLNNIADLLEANMHDFGTRIDFN